MSRSPFPALVAVLIGSLALVACGGVDSEVEAELAYVGLDEMVTKGLELGLQGFNEADSANIADQQTSGELSGTLTVGGQVDQGASDNKGLRLDVGLESYADAVLVHEHDPEDPDDDEELEVTYWSSEEDPPALDLQLRDMPDGSLDGTLVGSFDMEGDLDDVVTLDLQLEGSTEDDGSGNATRVEGATRIWGTASSGAGVYEVDVTR